MSKISERLECYQTQMSIYAEQHKIILANDVLDMIEQLQEDLEDDIEKVVAELEEWTFEADVIMPRGDIVKNNKLISSGNAIDIVRKGGAE